MVDASPCATPMPVSPLATVTNTEAPSPPAVPLPVFVPPSITDPVSNLDFLPVDDAFALEMRSESIEQLAGGDALRRGESERLEAGRSQTNADRVAGRDRVRVQGSLHEHTGHGLAEQAAHLHTTVEGTLDVHAGSEDTVLLAGHMRDLWNGGAAIVAAMTDDTVAGGGIRVTTPLDLWVHGLMGVEERIGTCTADAVLLELGATHYEREYGPGVHAAGLAVYTGSLYQSSRSAFRPLMRVKSGVRNLIAGGGGGGGGGDAGAAGAPGASPPPVPAGTSAAQESATATLAAGRSAAQAPASALDTADALTDARQVPLEELVHPVDARAGEEMGEAGIVMGAEDLPELTRSNDTAERLRKLRETLRIDAPMAVSEAAGGFRTSELDGAGSMHRASGALGALEIEPPSTVYGENARMVCPHPGNPRGERPEIKLGLPGGADRPPQPAAPESDFHTVERKLRNLQNYYRRSNPDIAYDFKKANARVHRLAVSQFRNFGGVIEDLPEGRTGITRAETTYYILQQTARQADSALDFERANQIRKALDAIYELAVGVLQALCTKHDITEVPSTQAMLRPVATIPWTVPIAAIPPPTRTPMQFEWGSVYRQLLALDHHFLAIRWDIAHLEFQDAALRMSQAVMRSFSDLAANPDHLLPPLTGVTRAEQAYRAIMDMFRQSTESNDFLVAGTVKMTLDALNEYSTELVGDLTRKYGALDALSTRTMQVPPVTGTPLVAARSTTVPPVERSHVCVPAHPIIRADNPAFLESAGGLVHTTGVPGPPPASGLPEPSLAAASGAAADDIGRGWLDPPATVSGTTAAQPVAIETIVTPSLGETSSFWLQPADPWPIRPPGMSGEPQPVAFGPWSAPPGPSSRVVYTEAIRTPVMSTGAPPGGQRAETPGFARAASGAVELPFSRREAITRRFGTEDAFLEAQYALQTGGADTLRWSAVRRHEVLHDLYWLNAIAQLDVAGAAAMVDVDWRAIEALGHFLEARPPSP